MKNYQLQQIKEAYYSLKELSGNKGFYVPLVKNIKLIDIELEALNEIKAPTKDFYEYLKEKEALLIKHSTKDDKGNPIKTQTTIDGSPYIQYDIPEEVQEALNAANSALIEKYNTVLEDMRSRELRYVEAMNSESDIVLHKIKIDDLPDMTPELFELIEEMVKYD